MKNGILYFLRMDLISWAARGVLLVIILSIPKLPIHGTAMPTAITVGVIAAVLSMFHVRSSRYVRQLIARAEEDFVKDFRAHHELSESCNVYVTRSYSADGKFNIPRRLDGAIIYPNMIFMSFYSLHDRTVVQIRTRTLLKKTAHEDYFFEVKNGETLDVKTERLDAYIEQALVSFPAANGKVPPAFPMKTDFHLRELLEAVGKPNNKV